VSQLRKHKEKLFLNKKVFRFNEKNWNIMNLNRGISFDFETIKFLCNNFKRRSFLDKFDNYRFEQNYINKLKESELDSRVGKFENVITYVMKKKQNKQPNNIQNIDFLFLHANEEMKYTERIEKYWLNINERSLKLKEKDKIDERVKQLENSGGVEST
jgi:hypothetical protein